MANGRNRVGRKDSGRDGGPFVALPWSVLDSPAFARLSMHARALLLEVARQFVRDNNGRLLLSRAYMATRGWKSWVEYYPHIRVAGDQLQIYKDPTSLQGSFSKLSLSLFVALPSGTFTGSCKAL